MPAVRVNGRTYEEVAVTARPGSPLPVSNGNVIPGLSIPEHDHITLSPPNLPTLITYRRGGAGGVVVATVTLGYSGTDIATVSRA